MSNNLEKFIAENKSSFDAYDPNPDLWQRISEEVSDNKKKHLNVRHYMLRIAVVLAIVITSVVTIEFMHQKDIQLISFGNKNTEVPELKEAEMYYSTKVNEKMAEIKPILANNPVISNELERDLKELDSLYQELKGELKDNVTTDDVIEAMIQNYRLRLEILEDVLSDIKKVQKGEDKQASKKSNDYEI